MKKNKLIALGLVAVVSAGLVSGCGNNSSAPTPGGEITVESGMTAAFHDSIKMAYGEDYLPSAPLDEEGFTQKFGIPMENVVNFVAEVPMIGTYVDTLVIVESAEGKTEDVAAALTAYREATIADTMQYPMNLAKINASKVYTADEYVFFIMLGAIDETNETEADQLAFAEAEIQKAIDAIDATAAK